MTKFHGQANTKGIGWANKVEDTLNYTTFKGMINKLKWHQ